jgi:glutamate-1-semialdehyde aminotransferase
VSMAAGFAAMNMMTDDAFSQINQLGKTFRDAIQEVFKLTDTDGIADGQYSMFAMSVNDPALGDADARGHVYRSSGLHQYMVQHGYWLTPGMVGILSTVNEVTDVARFCETLQDGIRHLRESQASAA